MNIIWTAMKSLWLIGASILVGEAMGKIIAKQIIAHRIRSALKNPAATLPFEDQLDISVMLREADTRISRMTRGIQDKPPGYADHWSKFAAHLEEKYPLDNDEGVHEMEANADDHARDLKKGVYDHD